MTEWPILGRIPPPDAFKPEHELEKSRVVSGVYLLCRGDLEHVVYVGQSSDLVRRWQEHREQGTKHFDRIFWYPIGTQSERLRLESILMLALAPASNRLLCVGFKTSGEVYQVDFDTLTTQKETRAKRPYRRQRRPQKNRAKSKYRP